MAELEDEDFSTIEHDFLHMKDYFNNYKFTYKERKSKLDFLQNICSALSQDSSDLVPAAKQQLVETKKVYKELDVEIKELSRKLYDAELLCKERMKKFEMLEKRESEMLEELRHLGDLENKLAINDNMNEELDRIEEEIRRTYEQIGLEKQKKMESLLAEKKAEEALLRETKRELAAKQKRLTIMNIDNYIEDLYGWHEQMAQVLESVFGGIVVEPWENGCTVRVTGERTHVTVHIQDKRLVEAKLTHTTDANVTRIFDSVCEYARANNDLPFLLFKILY